jgi:hypothetical protein
MSASAQAAARNSPSLGVAPQGRSAIDPRDSGGHGSGNGSLVGASSAEPSVWVSMASFWLIVANLAGHRAQHPVDETVRVVGGVPLGQFDSFGDAGPDGNVGPGQLEGTDAK